MRRAGSIGFWVLAALGGAAWLYDLVSRLRDAQDPGGVWMILFWSMAAGAALEVLFLIVRRWVIRSMATRINRLYETAGSEFEAQAKALTDRWRDYFGHGTGFFFVVVMVFLTNGAFVFDWFDSLTPIAFLVGFLIVWFSVGGHRYSPPLLSTAPDGE